MLECGALGNGIVKTVASETIEANSITVSGGDQLNQVAAIKIIKTDGTILVGERGAYARRGDTDGAQVDVQYSFNGPRYRGQN